MTATLLQAEPARALDMCLSEITGRALDEMVERIRALPAHAHLEVGRMVVEGLCGGLAAWHDRGADDPSFQRLAARRDLPRGLSSVATLSRCVGLYELDRRMGGCLSRWKGLGVSHFRAVLNLLHHQQVGLLDRADAEGWTARKLEREAARLRERSRGRRPLPELVKALRRARRVVEHEVVGEALQESAGLSRRELAEAARLVRAVRRGLAEAEAGIQEALGGAPPTPAEEDEPCTAPN